MVHQSSLLLALGAAHPCWGAWIGRLPSAAGQGGQGAAQLQRKPLRPFRCCPRSDASDCHCRTLSLRPHVRPEALFAQQQGIAEEQVAVFSGSMAATLCRPGVYR